MLKFYCISINILEPYDDGIAEAYQILIKIEDGKFNKHLVKYYAEFPIYSDKKRKEFDGILIMTEQSLLFCKGEKKLLYSTRLNSIKDLSVYEGGEDNTSKQKLYHLYVYTNNDDNYAFETVQYSLAYKTYWILSRENHFRKAIDNNKK